MFRSSRMIVVYLNTLGKSFRTAPIAAVGLEKPGNLCRVSGQPFDIVAHVKHGYIWKVHVAE